MKYLRISGIGGIMYLKVCMCTMCAQCPQRPELQVLKTEPKSLQWQLMLSSWLSLFIAIHIVNILFQVNQYSVKLKFIESI